MQKSYISHHGIENKTVIFLIGGWTYKHIFLWLPAKILELNGYYCISYTYPNDTFSPNYQKTTKNLLEIKNDILQRIKQLKKEGHNTFYVFGTSLGSVLAILVANESPDVSKIILNTVGADTAESVWSWDKINVGFKKELLKQNLTLESLIDKWQPISTRFNINNLKGKKILIYLSEKDTVIPYSQGKKLIQLFKDNKYDFQVILNPYYGHALTGMYNLLFAAKYLHFFKN